MNVNDNMCGRGDSCSTMTERNPCYRNLCYHAFGNEEEVGMAKEEGSKKVESSRPRQKSPKAKAKARGHEAKAVAKTGFNIIC